MRLDQSMQKLIEAVPGHDKEIYGISAEGIIAAGFLLILILIIREITGIVFPKIFSKISVGSEIAKNALSQSGKALGVAAGSWAGMHLVEDISWITSTLQLVLVVAIVVTAFRFVGVIHAFVMWTDDDGMVWEIDCFEGGLEGLILAEIELPSFDFKIHLPKWLGTEITGAHQWSNSSLAHYGLPEKSLE